MFVQVVVIECPRSVGYYLVDVATVSDRLVSLFLIHHSPSLHGARQGVVYDCNIETHFKGYYARLPLGFTAMRVSIFNKFIHFFKLGKATPI